MNVTCRDMGTSDIMACNNIFGRILVLSRHKVETKYNVVNVTRGQSTPHHELVRTHNFSSDRY
jgi:hypothetical protein